MSNLLRRTVSRNRVRIHDAETGADLDMAYITSQLMAVGAPVDKEHVSRFWRNDAAQLWQFVKRRHAGHFMILNLAEAGFVEYDYAAIDYQILDFFFPARHPPPLQLLCEIVHSIDCWLRADTEHVVIVHARRGKGPTGLAIAAYLYFAGLFDSIPEAQNHFSTKRAIKGKGIKLPSQLRYLQYFGRLLDAPDTVFRECVTARVHVRSIEIGPLPREMLHSTYVEVCDYQPTNASQPYAVYSSNGSPDVELDTESSMLRISILNFDRRPGVLHGDVLVRAWWTGHKDAGKVASEASVTGSKYSHGGHKLDTSAVAAASGRVIEDHHAGPTSPRPKHGPPGGTDRHARPLFHVVFHTGFVALRASGSHADTSNVVSPSSLIAHDVDLVSSVDDSRGRSPTVTSGQLRTLEFSRAELDDPSKNLVSEFTVRIGVERTKSLPPRDIASGREAVDPFANDIEAAAALVAAADSQALDFWRTIRAKFQGTRKDTRFSNSDRRNEWRSTLLETPDLSAFRFDQSSTVVAPSRGHALTSSEHLSDVETKKNRVYSAIPESTGVGHENIKRVMEIERTVTHWPPGFTLLSTIGHIRKYIWHCDITKVATRSKLHRTKHVRLYIFDDLLVYVQLSMATKKPIFKGMRRLIDCAVIIKDTTVELQTRSGLDNESGAEAISSVLTHNNKPLVFQGKTQEDHLHLGTTLAKLVRDLTPIDADQFRPSKKDIDARIQSFRDMRLSETELQIRLARAEASASAVRSMLRRPATGTDAHGSISAGRGKLLDLLLDLEALRRVASLPDTVTRLPPSMSFSGTTCSTGIDDAFLSEKLRFSGHNDASISSNGFARVPSDDGFIILPPQSENPTPPLPENDHSFETTPPAHVSASRTGSVPGIRSSSVSEPLESNRRLTTLLTRWPVSIEQVSLGAQIGAGSQGTVFRGEWNIRHTEPPMRLDVAVKLLDVETAAAVRSRKVTLGESGTAAEFEELDSQVRDDDMRASRERAALDAFELENSVMRSVLPSKYVLRLYGAGDTASTLPSLESSQNSVGRRFYMISEFCEQGSLHRLLLRLKRLKTKLGTSDSNPDIARILEHASLSPPVAAIARFATDPALLTYIIYGIAMGMKHLAAFRIVHRDLAARNILLTKHFEPKIGDFGFARILSPESEQMPSNSFAIDKRNSNAWAVTSSGIGPLKHMAPEAILRREYSEKSDVWSFGVTVFELLACSEPYPEMDKVAAAAAVSHAHMSPRLQIEEGSHLAAVWLDSAPGLQSLVDECCRFEREARPRFAHVVRKIVVFAGEMAISRAAHVRRALLGLAEICQSHSDAAQPVQSADILLASSIVSSIGKELAAAAAEEECAAEYLKDFARVRSDASNPALRMEPLSPEDSRLTLPTRALVDKLLANMQRKYDAKLLAEKINVVRTATERAIEELLQSLRFFSETVRNAVEDYCACVLSHDPDITSREALTTAFRREEARALRIMRALRSSMLLFRLASVFVTK